MKGIASLALLSTGSISGHFVDSDTRTCLGIYGTEIPCERECSHAEDYRLIDLTIFEFSTKKELHVIVECRGQDAARFHNVEDVHGWEGHVMDAARRINSKVHVTFQCETLLADEEAEKHITKYLPSLINLGVVVNIGKMNITGLEFSSGSINWPIISAPAAPAAPAAAAAAAMHPPKAAEVVVNETEGDDPEFNVTCAGDGRANRIEIDAHAHLMKVFEEELKAEGISEGHLLWEEDPYGWRTKTK